MRVILDHWPVVVAALGSLLLLVAVLWRRVGRYLTYVVRVARRLATDPRLPRSLRWLIGAGLAIKALPVPDLGIDEVLLMVAAVWLFLRHRAVLRAIAVESRTGVVDTGCWRRN